MGDAGSGRTLAGAGTAWLRAAIAGRSRVGALLPAPTVRADAPVAGSVCQTLQRDRPQDGSDRAWCALRTVGRAVGADERRRHPNRAAAITAAGRGHRCTARADVPGAARAGGATWLQDPGPAAWPGGSAGARTRAHTHRQRRVLDRAALHCEPPGGARWTHRS